MVLWWSLSRHAIPCVLSSFSSHLDEDKRAVCFAFIVCLMSSYCKCSVTLPHCAVGWSAVCDYGISA